VLEHDSPDGQPADLLLRMVGLLRAGLIPCMRPPASSDPDEIFADLEAASRHLWQYAELAEKWFGK
jgi:hypothetical protein